MKSFLLVIIAITLNNIINGQFIPSVAFHENLPAMYKTDKGWVISETVTNKLANYSDIIQFCKDSYPNDTIINAVPLFHKETISNWCMPKLPCSANDTFVTHPIECINTSYSYRPIYIPSYCKLNIDQGKGCLPFHSWKREAKTKCDENDLTLRDLQVIFPCKDKYMLFSEVEYICCSNRDEVTLFSPNLRSKLNDVHRHYTLILDDYRKNKSLHSEHRLFSRTKHALEISYHDYLALLNEEAVQNLIILIKKNDDRSSEQYKKSEQTIYETYKHNYESITHKFKRELLDLDNIHIRRIIKRSDNICRSKNNTEPDLTQCLKELDNISKKLNAHFRKMLRLHGLDHGEYLKFVESRLKHLYSIYLPLANGNKVWIDRFHGLLQKYSLKLESISIPKSKLTVDQRFKRCKDKATLYIHNQEHYLSLAPMVGIIAIIIFVLVAIVSILAYKYGANLCRRGTHNYVMRVVGDPTQSSQSINRPEVKLNLYENPIFNSKQSSKHIEKQGLIENMEN